MKIILSEKQIKDICLDLSNKLNKQFEASKGIPVFIGIMKGALPFMMDLIKLVNIPLEIDFMQASSYEGTKSTNSFVLKRDISCNITGRDVVIVEDIVDSGVTLNTLTKYLKHKYNPKSITTVALLDKLATRKEAFHVDLSGLCIGDEFVVGYGLDYYDLFRNVPYIFVPTNEEIDQFDQLVAKKSIQ